MNDTTAESEVISQQSDQVTNWLEEKREQISTETPLELAEILNTKLDEFSNTDLGEAEEKLAIKNIETSITQAQKLKSLIGHFETELQQAAQSKATVDTEISLFWTMYLEESLDPNQSKKLEDYLKEQFKKHTKENQVVNEGSQKINEEIEPEMMYV